MSSRLTDKFLELAESIDRFPQSISGGDLAPSGTIKMLVSRRGSYSAVPAHELSLCEIIKYGFPHFWLSREVAIWRLKNFRNLWRGLWRVVVARLFGLPHFYGRVSIVVIRDGQAIDYGLASMRVVTDTGVGYLVDSLQNLVEPENLKFHGFGTGGAAEAVGNTGLTTELTTQYLVDNTRPTGSQTEGATANIYRSVGTLSPDSGGTIAITEHGLFSAASAGVLLDRSLFSAVNLVAGSDSLQITYDLTLTSGG
jgi:hypothetical protein